MLYACGATSGFGSPSANVLRFDGATWTALPLIPATNAPMQTVLLDLGGGPQLYAAEFRGVWRLDGTQWTSVFGQVLNLVRRIAAFDDGNGPALYIAGDFTSLGGTPCGGIARWDGHNVDALGGGMTSTYPLALEVLDDGTGPALYAGGGFTSISGVACRGIAKWNGQTWSAVADNPPVPMGTVQSLSVFDDGSGAGSRLVAGGQSSVPPTYALVPKLAAWDGIAWTEIDGGISGAPIGDFQPASVLALATYDARTGRGPELFAAGSFTHAGAFGAANLARWQSCGGSAQTFCFGDGSVTACPCGNASAIGDQAGCLNSFGLGATLRIHGSASLAHDTLVLDGAQMTNSSALYFQAANVAFGGAGFAFGDGVKCTAGPFVRLRTKVNANGVSSYPEAGDAPISVRGFVGAPGVRHYQVHYRNSAAFCTPATFNMTNGVTVTWGP
jgi:hypothetical protein